MGVRFEGDPNLLPLLSELPGFREQWPTAGAVGVEKKEWSRLLREHPDSRPALGATMLGRLGMVGVAPDAYSWHSFTGLGLEQSVQEDGRIVAAGLLGPRATTLCMGVYGQGVGFVPARNQTRFQNEPIPRDRLPSLGIPLM